MQFASTFNKWKVVIIKSFISILIDWIVRSNRDLFSSHMMNVIYVIFSRKNLRAWGRHQISSLSLSRLWLISIFPYNRRMQKFFCNKHIPFKGNEDSYDFLICIFNSNLNLKVILSHFNLAFTNHIFDILLLLKEDIVSGWWYWTHFQKEEHNSF